METNNHNLESTTAETIGKAATIAMNLIPVAGGVMASIASEVIAKRQNRRLNAFLVSLTETMENLEDRLNRDFMSKEEFQDITEDIFAKAAETRQAEKLDALKAIFINTVLSEKPDYNETLEIASLVDRWQPRHIILLKILSNPVEADKNMNGIVGAGGWGTTSISSILRKLLPTWDEEKIERTWMELYDARIHKTNGANVTMTNSGIQQLENRITDYGKKVASYLMIKV